MTESGGFEMEPDEPEESPEPAAAPPPSVAPSPRHVPAPSVKRGAAARQEPTGFLAGLGRRRRARMLRVAPAMSVLYLGVAWFLVGGRYWLFPVAGLAVGIFGAWFRPQEGVFGLVAAAAALGAIAYARGAPFPLMTAVIVVPLCGLFGVLAAIDDRLAGP